MRVRYNALKTAPAGELQAKLSAADAEAAAKWPALAEIARAEADANMRALDAVNMTMRAEAVAGDAVQRWWRPIYALELVLECVAVWVIAFGELLSGGNHIATFVLSAQGLLTTYWMARFGVLGVYVGVKVIGGGAPPAGQLAPSVIDQIVKAVRRR